MPSEEPGSAPGLSGRLVGAALTCYPGWWKERYGEELEVLCTDLAASGRRPTRIAAGLAFGAVDARVRGTGIPAVASVHLQRARGALVAATIPVLVSFPLLLWVLGSTGTSYFSTTLGSGRHHSVTRAPLLGVAGHLASDASAVIALVAVCVLMILTVAWRQVRPVLAGRGRTGRILWWSPPALGVAALGIAALRARLVPVVSSTSGIVVRGRTVVSITYLPGGHPLLVAWLAVAVWVTFALMLASTVALAVVVGRSHLLTETLEMGVGICRLLSATSVLSAMAVVAWGLGLALQAVPPPHTDFALVHSSLSAWSGLLGGVYVVGAVLTVAGARQARHSAMTGIRLSSPGKIDSSVR
ncbi:MAG: hypothetical protein ACYDHU_04020 [Acidimicrobiales bacterium]